MRVGQDEMFRPAELSDLSAIRRYDCHIPTERLAGQIAQGFVYVCVQEGEIIGILRYSLFWQEHPFLDLLFLDERCRGQGIGRRFLSFWEAEMRRCGFSYVLTSTQADETAYRFYEKMGYVRCGSFGPPEQDAAELIYRKRL